MNRAVRALVRDHLVERDSIQVSRATVIRDKVLTAPRPRSAVGIGALVGAIVGMALTFALVLAASLWAPDPNARHLLTTIAAGGAIGALIAAVGTLLLHPTGERPSRRADDMYRDFLVSVDLENERDLGAVQRSLADTGGELVAST
jgi:hypothetical protein